MTTEEETKEERYEQALAIFRRMIANKKAAEKEAIDDYKNNPAK